MTVALDDARSRPEVGALVGLGVALYGLIYAAALVQDPVWALLVQPLTWITVSLCAVATIVVAIAAQAVALRLQRRREEHA